MAKSKPSIPPSPDPAPTQAAKNPILNRPYEAPTRHWVYENGVPREMQGRRPASFFFKRKEQKYGQEDLFAQEEQGLLPLPNRLRADVTRWREAAYPGATPVTRDLLAHWFTADRAKRPFFCQREAIETAIYLLELAIPGRLAQTRWKTFALDAADIAHLLAGERPGFWTEPADWPRLVDPPADPTLLPLRRLGCKMATGSGKTLVMGMLVAWAFCNRGTRPSDERFPRGVLVCAPNLTVRERLEVLKPSSKSSVYEEFDIIPAKYATQLRKGEVQVTNWHAFQPASPHKEGDSTSRVVDKGPEPNDAFALGRLGSLASRLPLLVLNDEGHHCWRPRTDGAQDDGLAAEEKDVLKQELEEARVWLAGLDRINNAGLVGAGKPGILATFDLSATPFYLAGSGHSEGSPFPWLVSDFGLVDAIESGIVKIPRLPVLDDTASKDEIGRPDPKYFRLWAHIQAAARPGDRTSTKRPKPAFVLEQAESALATLASQWVQEFRAGRQRGTEVAPIPPVLIVVADNTEIAQLVFEKISGERTSDSGDVVYGTGLFPELTNTPEERVTVRIDSKLLAKAEAADGQARSDAAEALRTLIGTVGQRGKPGEQVRCVVSVSMLTEGWDARNVTHILGIRAFGSQLLCEQVVGRGLRRRWYDVNPEGYLAPEYADVYGIPFSLIPFKGRPEDEKTPPNEATRIYTDDAKAEFRVEMPEVESYTYDLRTSGTEYDIEKMARTIVSHEPTAVFTRLARGYEHEGATVTRDSDERQDRSAFYAATREQQVVFEIARQLTDRLMEAGLGEGAGQMLPARHTLFPKMMGLVARYVRERVVYPEGLDARELRLERYTKLLVERIAEGVVPAASRKDAPLLPTIRRFAPVTSTDGVDEYTRREVRKLGKSHLNAAPILSDFEAEAIDALEGHAAVLAYAPNHRKRFRVPYLLQGERHYYEPDFIVRVQGGTQVLLEIKGGGGKRWNPDSIEAKKAGADKWVVAVNNARRFGRWAHEHVDAKTAREVRVLVRAAVNRHVVGAIVLPFRYVVPKREDRYRTCLPLIGLRAAAGGWSDSQEDLPELFEDRQEWVTWDGARKLRDGMFVAQVCGTSMEPRIPNGSYCVFRKVDLPSDPERPVLVRYSGGVDAETGGEFTVKLYRPEKNRVVLMPTNPAHSPLVFDHGADGDVRIVAEVVSVLAPIVGPEIE